MMMIPSSNFRFFRHFFLIPPPPLLPLATVVSLVLLGHIFAIQAQDLIENDPSDLTNTTSFDEEDGLYFVEEDDKTYLLIIGESALINCTVVGSPSPTFVKWERSDGKTLKSLGIKSEFGVINESLARASLIINRTENGLKGRYICTATDEATAKPRRLELQARIEIQNSTSKSNRERELGSGATIATVVVVVVITLLAVCLCSELHRRKSRNGLSKRDIELFHKGNPEVIKSGGYAHENVAFLPYDSSYELDEDCLKIDKENVLGAGSFGVVFQARYKGEPVAVKTIKPGSDKTYLRALLMELKVMIHIGKHPHIIMLIGACSKDLRRGLLNVVIELCPKGNMENYLRHNRYTFINQYDINGVLNHALGAEHPAECIRTVDLLRWSYQVADGLEYLGNQNVVHGDIAARNVLLGFEDRAKITDFGLSRQIYNYANYVKTNREPLPWRSMAIESLKQLSFSPMSDVWSFGVFAWELFTCGDIPYSGESWTNDFVEKLIGGLRPCRPKYATRKIYQEVMLNCWHPNPKDRISFTVLKGIFAAAMHDEQQT